MRRTALKRKTPLNKKSKSDTALIKEEIQAWARDIVIKRDGGCILEGMSIAHRIYFDVPNVPPCNGYAKDGHLILQADHLITRGNAATYADTRLIVCLCKGHHGWKSVGGNLRKAQYDALVKQILPPDRVALWEHREKESWKPTKVNWKIELAALKSEFNAMV